MKHKHITATVGETYHILGHEPILESFQEYICQLPKISNGICIFQTYLENNAWLHYLILLNSFTLLKHQCTCLHIQEIQLKSFVCKKDYHSLKGMIDLSTYQPVYNIKIIYDIYTLKLTQQYSCVQYSVMISQKIIQSDLINIHGESSFISSAILNILNTSY